MAMACKRSLNRLFADSVKASLSGKWNGEFDG